MTVFRLVLLFVLLCGLIASIPRLLKKPPPKPKRRKIVVHPPPLEIGNILVDKYTARDVVLDKVLQTEQ